jgi:hypothetical protein
MFSIPLYTAKAREEVPSIYLYKAESSKFRNRWRQHCSIHCGVRGGTCTLHFLSTQQKEVKNLLFNIPLHTAEEDKFAHHYSPHI